MLYIGPHVSIAKDISLSVERAHALGATGFAIFTKNQKVWHAKDLEEKSIKAFRDNLERYNIPLKAILPHAGYLINMATPNEELREKHTGAGSGRHNDEYHKILGERNHSGAVLRTRRP